VLSSRSLSTEPRSRLVDARTLPEYRPRRDQSQDQTSVQIVRPSWKHARRRTRGSSMLAVTRAKTAKMAADFLRNMDLGSGKDLDPVFLSTPLLRSGDGAEEATQEEPPIPASKEGSGSSPNHAHLSAPPSSYLMRRISKLRNKWVSRFCVLRVSCHEKLRSHHRRLRVTSWCTTSRSTTRTNL
jgi:hypothetical protein